MRGVDRGEEIIAGDGVHVGWNDLLPSLLPGREPVLLSAQHCGSPLGFDGQADRSPISSRLGFDRKL